MQITEIMIITHKVSINSTQSKTIDYISVYIQKGKIRTESSPQRGSQ